MARFLLCYSRENEAADKGWPRQGTAIEVNWLDDLQELQDRFGCEFIIKKRGYRPWWSECMDIRDAEDAAEYHHVRNLPEDWRGMRWVEILNGSPK
jgi:hypothetical protein